MKNSSGKIGEIARSISEILLVSLTILLPLLFVPYTSEFFEFNKSILFIIVSLGVMVCLAVRLVTMGSLSLIRSDFDPWLLLLLGSAVLAFIFSKSHITSLIGFSARMSEGVIVFSLVILIAVWVRMVATSRRAIELVLWGMLLGGGISSFIFLAHYFGVYLFEGVPRFEPTAMRSFSTVGSVNILPYVLLPLIPVSLGMVISNSKDRAARILISMLFVLVLSAFCLSIGIPADFKDAIAYIAGLGSLFAAILLMWPLKKEIVRWLGISLAVSVGVFLLGTVDTFEDRLLSTQDEYVRPPVLSYETGWNIAVGSMSESIVTGIIGTGNDTFPYSFTMHRPSGFSSSENWNTRFSRSSSQVFEVMGNLGVLGLVGWIGLCISVILWLREIHEARQNSEMRVLFVVCGIAIVSLMIASFITHFTLNIGYVFFLLLGLVVSIRNLSVRKKSQRTEFTLFTAEKKRDTNELSLLPLLVAVPVLVLFSLSVSMIVILYKGEVHYQDARYRISVIESEEDSIEGMHDAMESMTEAIRMSDFRDNFHADYGILSVNLLRLYVEQEEDVQGQDSEAIKTSLYNLAVEGVDRSTDIVPINVRNWEAKVYVYQELVKLTGGNFGEELLKSIDTAIRLDPVRPQLYHQKGVVLSLGGMDDEAIDSLQTAVSLQPLYLPARYDLGVQFQKVGMQEDALAQMDFIINVLEEHGSTNTSAYDQVVDARRAIEEGLIPGIGGVPGGSEKVIHPETKRMETGR